MARERRGAALTAAALGLMLPALAAAGEGRWTSQGPNADVVSRSPSILGRPQGLSPRRATSLTARCLRPRASCSRAPTAAPTWRALVAVAAGDHRLVARARRRSDKSSTASLSSGRPLREHWTEESLVASSRSRFETGLRPAVELDPRESRVVYVLGAICNFGPDRLRTRTVRRVPWRRVWRQRPGRKTGRCWSIDGATLRLLALAIDPAAPDRIYADRRGACRGPRRRRATGRRRPRDRNPDAAPVSSLAVGARRDAADRALLARVDGFSECGCGVPEHDGACDLARGLAISRYHADCRSRSIRRDPAQQSGRRPGMHSRPVGGLSIARTAARPGSRRTTGSTGRTPRQLAIDATGRRLYAATGRRRLRPRSGRTRAGQVLPPASQRPATRSSVRGPEAPARKASRPPEPFPRRA